MSGNVASFYLHTHDMSMDDFVNASDSLRIASLSQTMAACGALNTLAASRYVVSTLTIEKGDIGIVYDALYNPEAYESLWLLAFAACGDLYNAQGYRISSTGWDFEYSAESGAFYLSEDVLR